MDFELPIELGDLAAKAREVAIAGAQSSLFPEDSWLLGYEPAFTRQLGALGWIGMTWPVEEGGHGRSTLERFVVYEQLVKHGAPMAAGWFADRQIGPSLLQFGTPSQRRRWLPDIVAGTSAWCIGLSEPDAGSDLASLRTRAELKGDNWVVNGTKLWTSGAALADWCYLVARTDAGKGKHDGLSEFVVDMSSPGIAVSVIKDMAGNEHFCQITLNEVTIPSENCVGTLNGSFKQLMRQLEHERGGIDRLLSNYSLYVDVLGVVRNRDTIHPLTRQMIARIESLYRICRQMILREMLGQAMPGYSAATKLLATQLEVEVANFCGQELGPAALLSGAGLGGRTSRAICFSPAYTIMGGTVEILRTVIAERMLGLPRAEASAPQ